MRLYPLSLVLALAPGVLCAQTCPLDQSQITERIQVFASEARNRLETDLTNDIVDNVELMSPESKQVTAPAASGDSANLVDGADFNRLLGFAVENGFATSSGDAVTFDLNLFALKAAVDPSVLQIQDRYEQHSFLRRFSGALTFGGEGEPLDLDGDGVLEPARAPESLADVVTVDLRFRLSKRSRDRRDPENYELIQDRVAAELRDIDAIVNGILRSLLASGLDLNSADCEMQLDQSLAALDEQQLQSLGLALDRLNVDYGEVVAEIDSRTLWTLALSGTERERDFGRDKVRIGIRGAMGGDEKGWTFNFDYGETESLTVAGDPTTAKAAVQWQGATLKGLVGPGGLKTAFSAAIERFDNVPDAAHDEIAKLNAKWSFPLTDAISIPISLTWANHADLITDESEIRGHIGFTLDFDSLVKPR